MTASKQRKEEAKATGERLIRAYLKPEGRVYIQQTRSKGLKRYIRVLIPVIDDKGRPYIEEATLWAANALERRHTESGIRFTMPLSELRGQVERELNEAFPDLVPIFVSTL